jgi:hypothetical protein
MGSKQQGRGSPGTRTVKIARPDEFREAVRETQRPVVRKCQSTEDAGAVLDPEDKSGTRIFTGQEFSDQNRTRFGNQYKVRRSILLKQMAPVMLACHLF